jgi:hypothetical protein
MAEMAVGGGALWLTPLTFTYICPLTSSPIVVDAIACVKRLPKYLGQGGSSLVRASTAVENLVVVDGECRENRARVTLTH